MIILGDCLEKLRGLEDNSVDSVVTDPPYGISFMGKKWDYDVPKVEVWQEVLRVLKPGGHALVACGTRTQHRMAVNLEDAGFEIRDIVAWVYGSGFPKSLNIGKAVDKLQGNEREDAGEYKRPDGSNARTNVEAKAIWGNADGNDQRQTKGTSEWEGWGTALKPAMELWTLCRKPLEEKTIAQNVLKYGTGGINIDESRVGIDKDDDIHAKNPHTVHIKSNLEFTSSNGEAYKVPTGRFPANLIHDGSDEVVGLFPQTGKSVASNRGSDRNGDVYGKYNLCDTVRGHNDNGGSASRFFYCAKASKRERNIGCEGLEESIVNDGRETDIDNAFQRGITLRKNTHPTVKPVSLMRYLCRLITPKGGVILDPFMGSGTTGIGAKLEGFDFIGIEREQDYVDIAKARIEAWEPEVSLFSKDNESI